MFGSPLALTPCLLTGRVTKIDLEGHYGLFYYVQPHHKGPLDHSAALFLPRMHSIADVANYSYRLMELNRSGRTYISNEKRFLVKLLGHLPLQDSHVLCSIQFGMMKHVTNIFFRWQDMASFTNL